MTANPKIKNILPPVVLIKTWCQLLKDADPEINKHARRMLLRAFGSMPEVVEFVQDNNIKLR